MDRYQVAVLEGVHADQRRQHDAAAVLIFQIDRSVAHDPETLVGMNIEELAGDPGIVRGMADLTPGTGPKSGLE